MIDRDTGEVLAVTPPGEWTIWHEWEQASKGRRQIMWSRRRRDPVSAREQLWNSLLDVRGATADESDEAVAAADVDGEVVGEVSRADWYRMVVWRPELMTRLLETAEAEGRVGVAAVLAEIGVIAAWDIHRPRRVLLHDCRNSENTSCRDVALCVRCR